MPCDGTGRRRATATGPIVARRADGAQRSDRPRDRGRVVGVRPLNSREASTCASSWRPGEQRTRDGVALTDPLIPTVMGWASCRPSAGLRSCGGPCALKPFAPPRARLRLLDLRLRPPRKARGLARGRDGRRAAGRPPRGRSARAGWRSRRNSTRSTRSSRSTGSSRTRAWTCGSSPALGPLRNRRAARDRSGARLDGLRPRQPVHDRAVRRHEARRRARAAGSSTTFASSSSAHSTRKGELCGLRKDDVDLVRRSARLGAEAARALGPEDHRAPVRAPAPGLHEVGGGPAAVRLAPSAAPLTPTLPPLSAGGEGGLQERPPRGRARTSGAAATGESEDFRRVRSEDFRSGRDGGGESEDFRRGRRGAERGVLDGGSQAFAPAGSPLGIHRRRQKDEGRDPTGFP
jgi:hypothetical protein